MCEPDCYFFPNGTTVISVRFNWLMRTEIRQGWPMGCTPVLWAQSDGEQLRYYVQRKGSLAARWTWFWLISKPKDHSHWMPLVVFNQCQNTVEYPFLMHAQIVFLLIIYLSSPYWWVLLWSGKIHASGWLKSDLANDIPMLQGYIWFGSVWDCLKMIQTPEIPMLSGSCFPIQMTKKRDRLVFLAACWDNSWNKIMRHRQAIFGWLCRYPIISKSHHLCWVTLIHVGVSRNGDTPKPDGW